MKVSYSLFLFQRRNITSFIKMTNFHYNWITVITKTSTCIFQIVILIKDFKISEKIFNVQFCFLKINRYLFFSMLFTLCQVFMKNWRTKTTGILHRYADFVQCVWGKKNKATIQVTDGYWIAGNWEVWEVFYLTFNVPATPRSLKVFCLF